jgi:methylphosphotriester-DNA--protein-cysteine methyltransferase
MKAAGWVWISSVYPVQAQVDPTAQINWVMVTQGESRDPTSASDSRWQQSYGFYIRTTVFGYLHQYRMEQVRQLLEAGEMSVSAAGHRVGYSILSCFTTAFRKQFGVDPSAYRKLHHSGC